MSRITAKQLKKFLVIETPSGTINGSNTAFTLGNTPLENDAVLLFLNGLMQGPGGTDYSLSGTSITFTTAPATNSDLRAFYIRNDGE